MPFLTRQWEKSRHGYDEEMDAAGAEFAEEKAMVVIFD